MSKKVSMRYLIDVAIGNPEPGNVNFNALHTVLQAISEKLDLEDEQIEIDSSFCPVSTNNFDSKSNVSSELLMNHQVYDILPQNYEDELFSSNRSTEVFRNKNSTDAKKTHRSKSLQDRQTIEDRKVAFGQRNDKNVDEETPNRQGKKKSKNLDFKQQIDCLFDRLEKIENFAVWSVDTEQSVECLRQIVQQLQDKIDLLELSVCELRNSHYEREENISACRVKLKYDELSVITDALRKDLNDLKDSINGGDSKNMQMNEKIPTKNHHDLAEIARLNDQIIELKTNVCIFNEKLVTIEKSMAKNDKCSLITKLDLFQDEILNLKAEIKNSSVQNELQMLKELTNKLREMIHLKIDKTEVDDLLSEKADCSMLHEKVSVELMTAENCRFEKQLCEITDCVIINEETFKKQIDDIKKLVGDQNLHDMLHDFKIKINKDFEKVSDVLKKISETKPDIDSAVTRLKDLTCLSCDQDVVMKAVEINNLSKFSDAHVSKSISPSITFEVGILRQAGKIGVYNDDDIVFELAKKFRHSGGVPTIITNKERLRKTRMRKSRLLHEFK